MEFVKILQHLTMVRFGGLPFGRVEIRFAIVRLLEYPNRDGRTGSWLVGWDDCADVDTFFVKVDLCVSQSISVEYRVSHS